MSIFFYTPKGYVNLNSVQIAKFTQTNKMQIIVNDEIIDEGNVAFGETVISIIPTQGEWECLFPCSEDNGSTSILSEPVIAWGLTAVGATIPVIPSSLDGLHSTQYAIRKKGELQVYVDGTAYENENYWLEKQISKAK